MKKMNNRFVLLVANRLRPRIFGKRAYGRTAAVIAVAGVGAAVAVMLITIGVATGFNSQIKDKLLGFEPMISVNPPYHYNENSEAHFISRTEIVASITESCIPNARLELELTQPTILKTPDDFLPLALNGRENNEFIIKHISQGAMPCFPENDSAIVLSVATAKRMGIELNQRIDLCFFVNGKIRLRRLQVAALFETGFGEYDTNNAYASIGMLQALNGIDSITGTRLNVSAPTVGTHNAGELAERLQTEFIGNAQQTGSQSVEVVNNISQTGALYLNWLDLIDTNVVVIFILMCVLGALTLVSSLFIVVVKRISTIGILISLGATRKQISGIIIRQGAALALWGIIIGNVLALGLGFAQNEWGFIGLDPQMYYLNTVPFEFNWAYILGIDFCSLLLCTLVLIIPAKVASHVSPIATARYS